MTFMCLGFPLLRPNQLHFKFQYSIYLAWYLIYTTSVILRLALVNWYVNLLILINKSKWEDRFNQTDDKQNYIMPENMRIQKIKKGGVCKKRHPSVQESHATKTCHAWFCWYRYKACFLCLQMKQHDLDFPRKNKTILLFFFSFVMDCQVVVK